MGRRKNQSWSALRRAMLREFRLDRPAVARGQTRRRRGEAMRTALRREMASRVFNNVLSAWDRSGGSMRTSELRRVAFIGIPWWAFAARWLAWRVAVWLYRRLRGGPGMR